MASDSLLRLFLPEFLRGGDRMPDFSALRDFTSTQGVTDACIAFVLVVFLMTLACLIVRTVREARTMQRLRTDLSRCDGNPNIGPESCGHPAWRPYFRNLTNYGGGWRSVEPAETFFNDTTIGKSVIQSNVYPFVVTALTGLGVLGTFVGLTIGLQGFSLTGTPNEINEQINNMTACASTAFVTSVWGVTSSLLMNFIVNMAQARLRRGIDAVQRTADGVFPVESPIDAFMRKVCDDLDASKDTLDVLAEKIGDRFQESANVIVAAIAKQTTGAMELHQKTLEGIERQGEMIAERMASKIGDALGDSMDQTVLDSVRQVMDNSTRTMQNISKEIGDILCTFGKSSEDAAQVQNDHLRSAVEDLRTTLKESAEGTERMFERLNERQETFAGTLDGRNGELVDKLQGILDAQQRSIGTMMESTASLGRATSDNIQAVLDRFMTEATSAGAQQCQALKEASDKISQGVADNVAEAGRLFGKLAEQQAEHASRMLGLNDGLVSDLDASIARQKALTEEMDAALRGNVSASREMVAELGGVIAGLAENMRSMQSFSRSVEGLCTQIRSASESMERMGDGLGETMRQVGTSVSDSVTMAGMLVEENKGVGERLSAATDKLGRTGDALDRASESFSDTAASTAERYEALATHYGELGRAMDDHLRRVDEQIDAMMKGYAEQVEGMLSRYASQVKEQTAARLRSWDDETSKFCGAMQNVVAAMADLVDDKQGPKR